MQLSTPRNGDHRNTEKSKGRKRLRFFLVSLVFGALWVVLAGYENPSSWIIGGPAVVAASWSYCILSTRGRGRLSVMGIFRLLPFFFWESLKGGFDVTRRVLGRRLDVEPGLLEYPLRLSTPSGRVLFVGMVSLLPGTLSADLRDNNLLVHTLDVRGDVMSEIDRLERLMASCFLESLADRTGSAR
jgi:multicomponent Na+:H+ antiporter subunit E